MEKLNIAEILKDCPKGTKLYSPLCGECTFDNISFGTIICKRRNGQEITFTSEGCHMIPIYDDCECLLFPSKENRDWTKLQNPFKDGDIIYNQGIKATAIFHKQTNDNTISYCFLNIFKELRINHYHCKTSYDWRLATEEEKERLFKAIKDNGYYWNAETKTLEKLIEPKFKVGDRIKLKNTPTNNILTVTKTNNDGSLNVNTYSWVIEYELQDEYELVLNNQPNFKVGDKIKKNGDTRLISIKDVRDNYYIITIPDGFGNCYITDKLSFSNQDDYELAPNKFDITTLNPYDRVLVRDNNTQKWTADLFSFFDKSMIYPYSCIGHYTNQCIPYEGNHHLLGTTYDCDEYFKTWE